MNPSRGKNRVCLVVDEPKVGSDGKLVLPELAGILDLLGSFAGGGEILR